MASSLRGEGRSLNVVVFRGASKEMVDDRTAADLTGLLFKLRQLRSSALFDGAEIEVIRAEDGTPSLAMPLRSGRAFIVTPEPLQVGRYAILFTTEDGVEKLASNVVSEELYQTLMRRICPW